MSLIALKCPNCGSPVPRETMTCQYCGTSVVYTQNGEGSIKNLNSCPKCGNQLSVDAWFCMACGEVTTKNVNHLRMLKKKLLFQQQDLKNGIPEIVDKIEANEHIYSVFSHKGFFANKHFVATDKRLIKFENFGQYWEASLSDIVGISEPQYCNYGEFGYGYKMSVQTFSETTILDFGANNFCTTFYLWLKQALDNYNLNRKPVEAVIYSLKIPE